MKRILFISTAALAVGLTGTAGFAARVSGVDETLFELVAPAAAYDQTRTGSGADRLAKNGSDDGPDHDSDDDHSGRGRGGDDDDGDRHRGGDDDDDRPNDDGHGGRDRVPGGSGCDDPGDIAEHAGCSA